MKYTFIMNREIRVVYVGRKSSHYHVKTSVFLDLLERYIYAKKKEDNSSSGRTMKKRHNVFEFGVREQTANKHDWKNSDW